MEECRFRDVTDADCCVSMARSSDGTEWMLRVGDGSHVATVYLTKDNLDEVLRVIRGATGRLV